LRAGLLLCYSSCMRKYFYGVLITVVLCGAFFSCAGDPKLSQPSASLALVPQTGIKNGILGTNQQENPYMEPYGILRGRPTEFVVIRLDYAVSEAKNVAFKASVTNDKGEPLATLKTEEQMRTFWLDWQGDPPLNAQRNTTLSQTYIPDVFFSTKPGKHFYYAVLAAKSPIERPATVRAELRIDGMDPVTLEMPLPDYIPNKLLGLL
jgi:hypothetical protein